MFKQHFDYNNLNIDQVKESFKNNSAIQISNLFPKELCKKTYEFIVKNEKDIIKKFADDKRGLVLEKINKKNLIKYFDKPFEYKFNLFNKYLTSRLFNLSSALLNDDVYLDRAEIHSRCALGTPIPPHQDNAYFGLKGGKSLTFYISLNKQFPNQGGLRYYKIPIDDTKIHVASDQPGFSLTVKDKNFENLEIFNPQYEIGDCSIHHSTSIHFADDVPENSKRVVVLRLAIHGINDYVKENHAKWYKKMVEMNRIKLK